MRRREDHIQSALGFILAAVFLATAPWAAITIGGTVYGSELRTEHLQTAQRHPVTATVIDPGNAAEHAATKTLHVSWRDARGTMRTGDYQGSATFVGRAATIWVDRADHIVPAPHRHSVTITDTVMAGTGVVLVILAVLTSAFALLRRRLDRNRYRLWDAGWAWADIKWGQPGNRPEQG